MDDLRFGLCVAFSIILVHQYFIRCKLDKIEEILKDKTKNNG